MHRAQHIKSMSKVAKWFLLLGLPNGNTDPVAAKWLRKDKEVVTSLFKELVLRLTSLFKDISPKDILGEPQRSFF